MRFSREDVEAHFFSSGLGEILDASWTKDPADDRPNDRVTAGNPNPSPQSLVDLGRIHALIRSRKVTKVLEFGCGFSTLAVAHALAQNDREHGAAVRGGLRREDPFQAHAIDNHRDFIDLTLRRIPDVLQSRVDIRYSPVRMTTFAGRICTEYETIPNIAPDFIYLDGPSQFGVEGEVNGISTQSTDRLPMACDLLKIEHFLLPGTLILADGRTANIRFLIANFQRSWRHHHDVLDDVHYLELVEEPLGKWNQAQIEFCLGSHWPVNSPGFPSPS